MSCPLSYVGNVTKRIGKTIIPPITLMGFIAIIGHVSIIYSGGYPESNHIISASEEFFAKTLFAFMMGLGVCFIIGVLLIGCFVIFVKIQEDYQNYKVEKCKEVK